MKCLIVLPCKSQDILLNEGKSYLSRLRPPLSGEAFFITPKNIADEQKRKAAEGQLLLQKTEGFYRIALSENGKAISSTAFAQLIEKRMQQTSKMAFLIGGAFGLSPSVLSTCDMTISLSLMTLPHRMVFLFLCEQVFRSSEIINNTPYHK